MYKSRFLTRTFRRRKNNESSHFILCLHMQMCIMRPFYLPVLKFGPSLIQVMLGYDYYYATTARLVGSVGRNIFEPCTKATTML